ncbi:MAG: dipeptidase [Prolixibacteraceae bacterium]
MIETYIKEHKDRFLEELFGLLRIPSISTVSAHKPDMYRAADYWKNLLLEAGAERAEVFETGGNPVTWGEKIIDPAKPTVLVYGHMDVMPAGPVELWHSDPFEPEVRDGHIWARGANDNKGQSFMHAKAFELMMRTGTMPCNVRFMIEGEEEIGSPNLGQWCRKHRDILRADIILISDTNMIGPEIPAITTGLRGLAYWEVTVTGPDHDLHSGLYGGAVANPAIVLPKMIAGLIDDNGKITIPGFYDDVTEVSREERELLAQAPFDEEEFKKSIGVQALSGEKGYPVNEQTGIRPSFDVCGIWGGYTGEGSKTVLPSQVFAKLSARLVPNQDYRKISALFKEYFEKAAPPTVKVEVKPHHGGQAYVCPIDLPAYRAAEKAFTESYGRRPLPVRSGGSIPIVATFEEILGIKSVLMGFGLKTDAIHSPNESFSLDRFYKGIATIVRFYNYFGGL